MSNELLKAIPTLMNGVLLQDVDSSTAGEKETVVVLPNKNQIKVVNEVGSFILHLIDGKRTVANIVREIEGTYAAPTEQIESDVVMFIQQLVERQIIALLSQQSLGE